MSNFEYDYLEGRYFDWGRKDCLALFRDLYRDQFGIEITDYARPTNWNSEMIDLIRACYEREGFDMIPRDQMKAKDLRIGDVACIAVGSGVANHFAVFVGDNKIVHHKANTFSNSELFRDFWKGSTAFYLRHPDVPDMTPVRPDVDLGELVRASKAFKVPNS